jgi:hypothetical protein
MEDLQPILWKWLVRLIWLSSIVFFQIVELPRYKIGQAYRPFFGIYASVIVALVAWFLVTIIPPNLAFHL